MSGAFKGARGREGIDYRSRHAKYFVERSGVVESDAHEYTTHVEVKDTGRLCYFHTRRVICSIVD